MVRFDFGVRMSLKARCCMELIVRKASSGIKDSLCFFFRENMICLKKVRFNSGSF